MPVKYDFAGRAALVTGVARTGQIGHAVARALGAAGAIEAVVSLLVARTGEVPPTINNDDPDPECDLDCVPNVKRSQPVRVALSNSFGFGGHNVTLAVRAL